MRAARGPRPRAVLRTLLIAGAAALVSVAIPTTASAPAALASVAAAADTAPLIPVGGGPFGPDVQLPQTSGTAMTPDGAVSLPSGEDPSCPAPAAAGTAQCFTVSDTTTTGGYTPAQLQAAYNLAEAADGDTTVLNVAVVSAYNDPDAVSDFNTYRAQEDLPPCNTSTNAGCLTVVNQENLDNASSPLPGAAPASAGDWTWAESADVDTIAAICPECRIALIEANNDTIGNLAVAEENAAGATNIIDNDWGVPEFFGENADDATFLNHPGKAIVFPAGNDGYGTMWPAASQYVTAVGGTTLTADSAVPRGYTETAWADSGSGCSTDDHKPSWQTADDTSAACLNRTANDVAADADPSTGVAVYDSTPYTGSATSRAAGWGVAGGTSVAAAIITGAYALNGDPQVGTYPASYAYQPGAAADFYPVTSGSNGTCETTRQYLCNPAGSLADGFNGPTGFGSPDGTAGLAFVPPANGSDVITIPNPGTLDYEVNARVGITPVTPADSASSSYQWSATGLPSGLTINSATGVISGTLPSTAATKAVTVTATDGNGATGSVTFDIVSLPATTTDYHMEDGEVHLNVDGECLDNNGGATTDGNKIQIWGCDSDAGSQSWTWEPLGGPGGGGDLKLSGDTSMCLDIENGGTTAGSPLQLWGCNGQSNQEWKIESNGELLNPASGLCLTDPGSVTTYGTRLVIDPCTDAIGQQWTPTPSPVQASIAGMCLDDLDGSTANGNVIDIYSCNGDHNSQDWIFDYDGSIRLQGKANCLDATGAGALDGTPVQLWACNGQTNQQWMIGPNDQIVNVNAGKCLADPSNSAVDGTHLVLEDCYGQPGEVWDAT